VFVRFWICETGPVADGPQLAVVAKLRAPLGRRDELIAALLPLFDGMPQLPGTSVFCLHIVADDPDAVVFYELHRDEAAFHAADEAAVARLGSGLEGLLAEPPDVTVCRAVRLYGLNSAS
jgi:quinol monooxygenase YgiN